MNLGTPLIGAYAIPVAAAIWYVRWGMKRDTRSEHFILTAVLLLHALAVSALMVRFHAFDDGDGDSAGVAVLASWAAWLWVAAMALAGVGPQQGAHRRMCWMIAAQAFLAVLPIVNTAELMYAGWGRIADRPQLESALGVAYHGLFAFLLLGLAATGAILFWVGKHVRRIQRRSSRARA